MVNDQPFVLFRRIKYLFWGVLMLIGPLYFVGYIGWNGYKAVQLAKSGIETIATVVDSHTVTKRSRKKVRTYHEHHIRYDDRETTITRDRLYPPGTVFYAVYAPDRPDNVMITIERENARGYFLAYTSPKSLLFLILFGVGGGFFSYRAFRVGFLSSADLWKHGV